MKRKNWLLVLLILGCLAALYGYRTMVLLKTDNEPPQIEIPQETAEFSVHDPRSALVRGITATDKTDGDVTASLVVENVRLLDSDGTIRVDYAAFDKSGNVEKAHRTARYTDYESPRFTLEGPLAYTYGSNFDVLSTVGAVDAVDGDIQHRVRATTLEESSVAITGTHQIQFQVTNSLGDTVSYVFPVEIYPADAYNATLELTDYILYMKTGESFVASRYLKSFILQGEETNLRAGVPRDFSLKTTGTVDTSQPGTYSVDLRLTYTQRHDTNPDLDRKYTAYSKLIVVVEG